jgi:glutamine amidotransferase PdxT
MAYPDGSRFEGGESTVIALPGHRDTRRTRIRKLISALATVAFCAGVTLLPALVALDVGVGLACRTIDRAACVALVLKPAE